MAGMQGIGSARIALTGLAILIAAQCCMAATYNVGDSQGWSQNVNYNTWASSHTFQVGDTIVFTYSGSTHSVLLVSQADFTACNVNTPLRTYSTGKDTFTLTNATTYNFICGTLGHCASGMALSVSVTAGTASPSPAPTLSPAPSSSPAPTKTPTAAPEPAPAPAPAPKPIAPSSAPSISPSASSHSPGKAPTPTVNSAPLRPRTAAMVVTVMLCADIALLLLLL
ncbi:hypothetical protein O6H91_07G026800 [Diphasiastrum complanatum]|uniref:Uncharacterized protein n=2 Tax=Diphasiastrum complanatum TaxID=34168 RepID=A0ACC2D3H9_DIPCM|nr:hypothetical protein O6H91_07G026800 [Diphasiastrum complanatum]